MHRAGLLAAAMTAMLAGAGPALAGAGAMAYDQSTGRYGFAWNESSPERASQLAIKDCGSDKCRAIPVPPAKCGALATTDDPKKSTAWAAAVRDRRSEAELAAMQDCQKRTAGQCKIRGSECNK